MLEEDVVQRFKDACVKAGCAWIHKNHGGPMGGGRVDQELCFNGILILAEAKRSKVELNSTGGVTALQWNDIERARKAGAVAFAYTLEPTAVRGIYNIVIRWHKEDLYCTQMLLENFVTSLKVEPLKFQAQHIHKA